eukprot:scaffold50958_cov59-Phaeocystis_antarctica.AAC.2
MPPARLGRASAAGCAKRADRAFLGRREASSAAERARHARQGRSGADPAVGACDADVARRAAAILLEGAGLALETCAHVCVGCNRPGAAGYLLRATRRCVKPWVSGHALGGAAEVSGARVRSPATRQRRRRALRAKGAALARARARCGSRCALVLARDASGASHTAFSVSHAPWEAVHTRRGCAHRAGLTGLALDAKAAVCSPDVGVVGAGRALFAVDCGAAAEAACRALLAAARADGCIELPRRTGVATCTCRTLSVLPWEARQANHTRRTIGMLPGLAGGAASCRPCALTCADITRHALAFLAGIRPQWTLCQHAGFATARSQGPIGSLGHKVGDALQADRRAALAHGGWARKARAAGMQLGAAIGTVREHKQLVRAAICAAVASEKIQLSVPIDISKRNGARACTSPWEAGSRQKGTRAVGAVAVDVAERHSRRGGTAATIKGAAAVEHARTIVDPELVRAVCVRDDKVEVAISIHVAESQRRRQLTESNGECRAAVGASTVERPGLTIEQGLKAPPHRAAIHIRVSGGTVLVDARWRWWRR